jgi:membrane-bound lytic murein transglycosylase D
MQKTTRNLAVLAAVAASFAPASSFAIDTAPATVAPYAAPAGVKSAPLQPFPVFKTEEYKETDVWGRIRSGYAIPDLDNALVGKHVTWYTNRPDQLAIIGERASRYMFHVVTELEKRNMPTELALLPIIESAFNPQANSSAKAAGLWQFVPGTGRDFNLQQNMFKDERRSALASTDAALSYLQKLYGMFGDWQLALAAYNWGEGNVQKAVKKNQAAGKPIDFDSLSEHMPAETRNYVPKLQAVKNIIANPVQYGVKLPVIQNQPYFTVVDKANDIDLAIAAQLAEMSVDEFKALNPQFKKPVITGGEQTKILLPHENAKKFEINLAQWGQALSTWTTHKISNARESIASLARRFGTTPDVIRQANNLPSAGARLKAGSTILVPKTAAHQGDIAEAVVENAVLAMDERSGNKRVAAPTPSSKAARIKAKAVSTLAELKSRVSSRAASKRETSGTRRRRNG